MEMPRCECQSGFPFAPAILLTGESLATPHHRLPVFFLYLTGATPTKGAGRENLRLIEMPAPSEHGSREPTISGGTHGQGALRQRPGGTARGARRRVRRQIDRQR